MESAEEGKPPPGATSKPPPPIPPTPPKAISPTTAAPAAAAAAPASYPEWAASVQAFYPSGPPGTPGHQAAFFSPAMASSPLPQPYVWGGQPMLTPYGTPIYSPVYFQGGTYAHPSMAMATGTPYAVVEAEGRPGLAKKPAGGDASARGKSGDEEEDLSQSESEGSSEARDDSSDPQDSSTTRKRNLSDTLTDVEASQRTAAAPSSSTTVESSYSGRGQTSGKLPVSAPGRVVMPGPAPNLNIGMDLWNAPHADPALMKARPNVSIAPAMASSTMVGRKGVMPEQQWVQDERELKRQRRKQSNRESARRSRLRKQQECEDLARRVDELNNENNALRNELEHLNKDCKELESENESIMEELTRLYGPGVVSAFEGTNNDSTSIQSVDAEGRDHGRQRK